jgi:hypothetical protein
MLTGKSNPSLSGSRTSARRSASRRRARRPAAGQHLHRSVAALQRVSWPLVGVRVWTRLRREQKCETTMGRVHRDATQRAVVLAVSTSGTTCPRRLSCRPPQRPQTMRSTPNPAGQSGRSSGPAQPPGQAKGTTVTTDRPSTSPILSAIHRRMRTRPARPPRHTTRKGLCTASGLL